MREERDTYRCKRLRDWTAWGYDYVLQQRNHCLRAPVYIALPGVIMRLWLAPPDAHEHWAADDLLAEVRGWVLGVTPYWSPTMRDDLAHHNAHLLTPSRSSLKRTRHPWPRWLTHPASALKPSSGSWSNASTPNAFGRAPLITCVHVGRVTCSPIRSPSCCDYKPSCLRRFKLRR